MTEIILIEDRVVLTPQGCAAILLREFSTTDKAIAYAEKIARSATRNGNGKLAQEYDDAARLLRCYAHFGVQS